MKVFNMSSLKSGKEVPNQFIIKTNKGTFFQSYDSLICFIQGDKVFLTEKWNYSKTTMKYLSSFLRVSGKKEIEKKLRISGEYQLITCRELEEML